MKHISIDPLDICRKSEEKTKEIQSGQEFVPGIEIECSIKVD